MDDRGRVIIDLEVLAEEGMQEEDYLREQERKARADEVRRLKREFEAAEIRSRKRIAKYLKKMRQGDM